jgi:hypothetical protein
MGLRPCSAAVPNRPTSERPTCHATIGRDRSFSGGAYASATKDNRLQVPLSLLKKPPFERVAQQQLEVLQLLERNIEVALARDVALDALRKLERYTVFLDSYATRIREEMLDLARIHAVVAGRQALALKDAPLNAVNRHDVLGKVVGHPVPKEVEDVVHGLVG